MSLHLSDLIATMNSSSSSNHDQSIPKSTSALEVLNKYRPSFSRITIARLNELASKEREPLEEVELSTVDIMRVAAACFVRSSDDPGNSHELIDPSSLSPSGRFTNEDMKKIDLVYLLLDATNNLSKQEYHVSAHLLTQCLRFSSSTSSPVERVVHYFSLALQERIDKEIGGPSSGRHAVVKALLSNDDDHSVQHQKLPLSQLVHFISVQTIIDNVASAKRINVIDISIKHGLQWTTLIQALATRSMSPVDRLTITAITSSEIDVATAGRLLASFAETLGLPFNFKTLIVEDMRDVREEMFQVAEGETVAVYSSMDMNPMIARQDGLENLMKVLRKLKPCVMTVVDVEANMNSSSFIVRFTEALFHFGTLFDYLDVFMNGPDITRMAVEEVLLSQGITNIIATEGSERVVRHVGISVWRSFFSRFRLVETELNEWSMYQANFLVEQLAHGESCTIDKNGKALILGWKSNPLLFVSAWKFM